MSRLSTSAGVVFIWFNISPTTCAYSCATFMYSHVIVSIDPSGYWCSNFFVFGSVYPSVNFFNSRNATETLLPRLARSCFNDHMACQSFKQASSIQAVRLTASMMPLTRSPSSFATSTNSVTKYFAKCMRRQLASTSSTTV